MNTIQLTNLPGCRPLAEVSGLGVYLGEKGANYVSDSAAGIGLDILPEGVESLAARDIEQIKGRQGSALYVNALVELLEAATRRTEGSSVVRAEGLGSTALTDLFMQLCGGQLLVKGEEPDLAITGVHRRNGTAGLNYIQVDPSRHTTFFQLALNGVYGFVNMSCTSKLTQFRGEGNVAFMDGVEEALREDIGKLS